MLFLVRQWADFFGGGSSTVERRAVNPVVGSSTLLRHPMTKTVELESLWKEKRGRRDTNAGLALYIALNNPKIYPLAIISETLNALSENPRTGLAWAEDFGRVVVSVNPLAESLTSLRQIDDSTKSYVRVESSKLITPSDVLGLRFGAGRNQVYLNNKPLTVEGLTLQIARSVDEAVWNSKTRKSISGYRKAVDQVKSEGLEIYPTSEDEILNLRRQYGKKFPIRLYGSGAITTMPTIICGVYKDEERRCYPVTKVKESQIIFPKLRREETKLEGQISAAIWVTIGKRLTVSHLFTTCVADLVKRGCGNKGELVIASNDTGPRVAALVTSLSTMLQKTIFETTKELKGGLIDPEKIILAYRQRDSDLIDPEALSEVAKGGGILRVMENLAIGDLSQAGFSDLRLTRESESDRAKIDEVNPEWKDYGFLPVSVGNKLSILAKNGELTAVGQGLGIADTVLNRSENFVLVDSDSATTNVAEISQSLGKRVVQVFGTGVSIRGKLGSGTSGELPTIQELTQVFGNKLAEIARFYVLTQPQIVTNGNIRESSFDFSSQEDIFRTFRSYSELLDGFKLRVLKAKDKLRAIPVATGDIQNDSARLQYLSARLEQLKNPNARWIADNMKRPKRITNKEGQFLVKRKNPYYSELIRDLGTIEEVDNLSVRDATMLREMLDVCTERVGIFI